MSHPLQTSWTLAHAESRADCSPTVCALVSRSHCKAWCQLLACRPHEGSKHGSTAPSLRGPESHPHYRGIVRYCRRLSTPWFLGLCGTATILRDHHGTAPPDLNTSPFIRPEKNLPNLLRQLGEVPTTRRPSRARRQHCRRPAVPQ